MPQTCVSFLEHQSDAPDTLPSLVNRSGLRVRDSLQLRFTEPIFLESEYLNEGQFSSVLLTSPKRSVVAPIPTTVVRYSNHPPQTSSTKRSNSCGNHSSGIAAAALSCLCLEASASSDPVERAEPDDPSEAVGDLGRRSHQNYPRRFRRQGVRN